jgi:hypothetical protein
MKKKYLITALCILSIGLTGCGSSFSDLSNKNTKVVDETDTEEIDYTDHSSDNITSNNKTDSSSSSNSNSGNTSSSSSSSSESSSSSSSSSTNNSSSVKTESSESNKTTSSSTSETKEKKKSFWVIIKEKIFGSKKKTEVVDDTSAKKETSKDSSTSKDEDKNTSETAEESSDSDSSSTSETSKTEYKEDQPGTDREITDKGQVFIDDGTNKDGIEVYSPLVRVGDDNIYNVFCCVGSALGNNYMPIKSMDTTDVEDMLNIPKNLVDYAYGEIIYNDTDFLIGIRAKEGNDASIESAVNDYIKSIQNSDTSVNNAKYSTIKVHRSNGYVYVIGTFGDIPDGTDVKTVKQIANENTSKSLEVVQNIT